MEEPVRRASEGAGGPADNEIERLQREVLELRTQLAAADAARREVLDSTSWRITRPLRAIKSRWMPVRNQEPHGAPPPLVPAQLSRFAETADLARENETYALLDVSSALQPLRRMPRLQPGMARIAFVGSLELAAELEFDAEVLQVREADWRESVQPGRFDYLLLETVWSTGSGDWRYSMVAEGRARDALVALVGHARSIGLPVVLWFREDARNYARYAWLLRHVDRIYVIDEALAALVRKESPQVPVGVLPPAIQPALHNPVCSYAMHEVRDAFRSRVLFDGWWDAAAEPALRAMLKDLAASGLRVCESEWDFGRVRLQDIPELAPVTYGCVDGPGKAVLNKLIEAELFFPRTLRLPWRQHQAMLRAAAAGSAVGFVGQGASGFAWCGSPDQVGSWLARLRNHPLEHLAASHRVRRELLAGHCLRHRLERIGGDLGLPGRGSGVQPSVAMVLVTMRPQLLEGCIERFRQDAYPNKELVVVLHGDHALGTARALVRPGEKIRFLQLGTERSLGACLNQAIEESEADYWAKVDDDDFYGRHYLSDLMAARLVSDFDVAGKPPMFAYLESDDGLYFDTVWSAHAHLWHAPGEAKAALVAGGTLTGKRDVLASVRFSETRRGGSDSEFVRRCYESGYGVLAVDGFNFARYRSSDAGFHTWQMDERELQERATRLGGLKELPDKVFV